MHKDYWVAIGVYAVALVLTALPFLGIVTVDLGLDYNTLKFLHIVFVVLAISILVGQMITFNVLQHEKIATPAAIQYLSLLDHAIPVCLVMIGLLGYSMASRYGPIWQVPWIHEGAFGLVAYTLGGLIMTMIFRRLRFQQEGGLQSPAAVYLAAGLGVVLLLVVTALMVYKAAPTSAARHFTGIAKYFAGP